MLKATFCAAQAFQEVVFNPMIFSRITDSKTAIIPRVAKIYDVWSKITFIWANNLNKFTEKSLEMQFCDARIE